MSTEQTTLPEGLSIAVEMVGEYVESVVTCNRHPVTGELAPHAEIDQRHGETAIDAIRNEHAQRLTLQHHAADQAQRIADLIAESEAKIPEMQAALEERLTLDRANRLLVARVAELESIVSAPRGADAQILKEREIAAAAIDGALAFGHQGVDAPEAGHWLLAAHNAGKRIAELEAERDELRAELYCAEEEIEVASCALESADNAVCDGHACMGDYIRAVTQALIKERDELRARLDAAEKQEPVAEIRTWHKRVDQHADLIDWCDAIENLPDGDHKLYAAPVPAQAAPDFDVTLDEKASQYLRDMTEPAEEGEPATTVRLLLGDGHSGRGLYVCSAEYPGEGSVLLAASPEAAR